MTETYPGAACVRTMEPTSRHYPLGPNHDSLSSPWSTSLFKNAFASCGLNDNEAWALSAMNPVSSCFLRKLRTAIAGYPAMD
jgi:hypothetical protein